MNISLETTLILESIRLTVLNDSKERFKKLVRSPFLDWRTVDKLVHFHAIRPLFYQACEQVGFTNKYIKSLEVFCRVQTLYNLAYGQEALRTLKLMEQNGIRALPYKGLLFLEKIYDNQQLREIGDFDLLVSKADAIKSIRLLLESGFKLKVHEVVNEQILNDIVSKTPNYEVGLYKELPSGVIFHIDLHWEVCEAPQYNFKMDDILDSASLDHFQGEKCLLPNPAYQFKMLLNHHGGRDCWLSLKHVVDLAFFMNKYPWFKRSNMQLMAQSMKMERVCQVGLELLDIFVYKIKLPQDYYVEISRILQFWENGVDIKSLYPKFLRLRIYRKLQDESMSWWQLMQDQMQYHGQDSPVENKRLMVLPQKFTFLNTSIKFISYLKRFYVDKLFT
jgi:hypothetical protein